MSVRTTPTCLVIGGSGFLGSHLVRALLERGYRVRVFDRGESGSDRLAAVADRIERVTGDVADEAALRTALAGVRFVFVFASFSTPASSVTMGTRAIEREHRIMERILALSVAAGVERVLFPSSGGGIYGHTSGLSTSEMTNPRPITPHTMGKLYAEKALAEYHRRFGLDHIIYRIGNPYGEGQTGSSSFGVVPALLKAAYEQTPATLYGDTVRDYVYVKDVAAAIVRTFDQPHAHHVYNVGSGQGTRLSTLLRLTEIATGVPITARVLPRRPFDVDRIVLDIGRLRDEFGYAPDTGLLQGLRQTYDEYVATREKEIISLPTLPRPVRIRNLTFSF